MSTDLYTRISNQIFLKKNDDEEGEDFSDDANDDSDDSDDKFDSDNHGEEDEGESF